MPYVVQNSLGDSDLLSLLGENAGLSEEMPGGLLSLRHEASPTT